MVSSPLFQAWIICEPKERQSRLLTITAPEGSYAAEFAVRNGYGYKPLK